MIRLWYCIIGVACAGHACASSLQLAAQDRNRKSFFRTTKAAQENSVICLSESWHHLLLQVHSIKQIIGRQYGDGVVADAQRHW